jgi:hypothetical protein
MSPDDRGVPGDVDDGEGRIPARAVCYKLLEHLGEDSDTRIKSFDFTLRVDEDDLGTARAGGDRRVNIFYYRINDWFDFIAFNVCMDRGAGHQLEDVLMSSYRPWARVMEGIFKEEMFHIAHGDNWMKRLAADRTRSRRCRPRSTVVPADDEHFRPGEFAEEQDLPSWDWCDNQEVRRRSRLSLGPGWLSSDCGCRVAARLGKIPEEAVFAAG